MREWSPLLLATLAVVATVLTGAPALAAPSGVDAQSGADQPAVDGADRLSAGQPANETTASSQSSRPVVTVPNTSSYLALSGGAVETSRFAEADLDVTASVAIESDRFRDQFLETSLFQAFNSAESTRQQTELLRRAANEIEARSAMLQSLQAQTIRQYNRGQISTDLFLRRMALIDARARQLSVVLDRVLRAVGQSPTYSLPNTLRTRFQNLQVRPSLMQGPTRQRITAALSGAQSPASVYVETSGDGIVLARTSGNNYVREAFVGSEYRVRGSDQVAQGEQAPISAAYDQARQLYPWTIRNSITVPSASGFGNTSVYRITVDHTQGTLVSYLDGTTTSVFREIQDKRIAALPIAANATNTTDQLRITANRTHPTGPVEITVGQFNSTRTVDARIRIDDQFVGHTGSDGRLWTIEPTGPTTVVAVTDAGERVRLSLPGS